MCGIVGLFTVGSGSPPHREMWLDLVNHLFHRGPDEGGFWADGPFFLGSRRLSIIDIEHGHQPMALADGSLVVVCNGEIYNYVELRNELQAKGHVFRTLSDVEVLLHGYRAWGDDLPGRLKGMFAFAIADRKERKLFLARDRFGEKPLFYVRTPGYFAFASEVRPLAALPEVERKLDIEGLAGFLALNYVPGTRSLLAGVTRLAPGTWMICVGNSEQQGRYWSVPRASRSRRSVPLSEAQDVLTSDLDAAVRLSMRSDVPVGILLSGGMDSSLVAESAMRQGQLSKAYFVDFEEQTYSEYTAARLVADRLGLPLERIVLTPRALLDFENLADHADDPLADSSALAVWVLSRLAAKGNKVVLSGDGGDELFGGYQTYLASRLHSRYVSHLPKAARRALASLASAFPTRESKTSLSYRAWRFLRASDLPSEVAHFTWNGTWLPSQVAKLIAPEFRTKTAGNGLAGIGTQHGLGGSWDLLRYQLADIEDYLPNDILAKTDRMSMAHGLEVRAPFLMHDLAERALAFPEDLKIGPGGKLKLLLRSLARSRFGAPIADRPKQGFSIPVHSWIRGAFAEPVRDLLSPPSVRRIPELEASQVESLVEDHFSGRWSYGFELWGLAVLVAWHRRRIERRPACPVSAPLHEIKFPIIAN